jgi:large subunit ribosomal protein L9
MRVVFLEEVEGTARTGDVKNVADGFARNFLLPRKLAAPATDHYITIAQAKATKEARRQSKLDEDAQKLVPQVEGKEITIEVRVGEQEKMFGSVTARDIAELLQKQTKIEIEHRQIDLKQPIRELGSHAVSVKLTRNVLAGITVHVQPIGGVPEAEEAPMIEGVTESGEPSAIPTETHTQEPAEGTREESELAAEGAHSEEPAEGAAAPVDESASEAEVADAVPPPEDSDAAETPDVADTERTSEEGE